MFYRRMNMIKSSKHAVGSFMHLLLSSQFVRENSLVNRPHASLWLGKTYVLPAGMYAGQVWGTEHIKEDKVFMSDLQVRHMSYGRARWVLSVPLQIGLSRGSVDTSHCSFTGSGLL